MAKSNGNNLQEISITLQDQALSLGDKTLTILKIGSLTDLQPSQSFRATEQPSR